MRLLAACVFALLAVPAAANEFLVFKKDSPYRGAALEVRSYERKDGRLIIVAWNGDVYSATADSVDWETSRRLTEQKATERAETAARQRAEDARKAAALAARASEPQNLVEASRRYGVEKPGMSVAEGSATARPSARPEAGPKPEGESKAGGAESGQAKLIRGRLEAAVKEREQIGKDIERLEKDNNPDPLWATKRESQLKDKREQLAGVDRRIENLRKDLERATAAPAPAKAKE